MLDHVAVCGWRSVLNQLAACGRCSVLIQLDWEMEVSNRRIDLRITREMNMSSCSISKEERDARIVKEAKTIPQEIEKGGLWTRMV
eukprot:COSAG02_NODE_2127_length_9742_cov_32.510318_3_plen_86_part_00